MDTAFRAYARNERRKSHGETTNLVKRWFINIPRRNYGRNRTRGTRTFV